MAAIVSDLPPPPAPILLEADHVSITCAWDKIDGARQFELEMTEVDENGGEVGWQSLSNKLKTNQAKKKNLVPEKRYAFRYRYLADVSASGEEVWSPFSDRSDVLQTVPDSIALMEPPQLVTSDGSSITISWTPLEGTAKYKLRFRRAESVQWEYVSATLTGSIAKKKGLSKDHGYIFAVAPEMESETVFFSAASGVFHLTPLSPFLESILPRTLLSKSGAEVNTADALAGKVVAMYFSAHWCGPCRQFTPQLRGLYQQVKAAGKLLEIVFCSADHDEREFQDYYSKEMPWLAIKYDSAEREALQARFKVSGIPMLSVMAPSGKIIVANAIQAPGGISMAAVDSWIAQSKTM